MIFEALRYFIRTMFFLVVDEVPARGYFLIALKARNAVQV